MIVVYEVVMVVGVPCCNDNDVGGCVVGGVTDEDDEVVDEVDGRAFDEEGVGACEVVLGSLLVDCDDAVECDTLRRGDVSEGG